MDISVHQAGKVFGPGGLARCAVKQRMPPGQASTLTAAPTITTARPSSSPATAAALEACLSGHPDAILRRRQHEERRRRLEEERQAALAAGVKWYEGPMPDNMFLCGSPEEYKQLLTKASTEGRLLVAKFFTEECYVCKSLHPKIKSIAKDNPDVLWVKLNGSNPQLTAMFEALGITKVPLFHMVLDGELVSEMTASLSPEKLAMFRRQLAAHKASAQAFPQLVQQAAAGVL